MSGKNEDGIKIGSVNRYLEVIEELSKSYPSNPLINIPTVTKFLFRGMSDERFSLLPSILREQAATVEGQKIINKKYIAWDNETTILRSFIIEASGIVNGIPSSDLYRWAEYAQHFGAPTRLLDWTANPLTAMYFACCKTNDKDPVVWVINLSNYSRFAVAKEREIKKTEDLTKKTYSEILNLLLSGKSGVDYPIVYQPYYVDQRMSAQSSFFMAWGNKDKPFEELIPQGNWMLPSNLDNHGYRSFGTLQETGILLKLIIHNDRKQEIIRQLDMLGINEKTLFPGLDGIGRYIERKFRFDYDEVIGDL